MIACGGSRGAPPDAPAPGPDAPLVEHTFRVFDQIPQFGIYVSTDPANYTPPSGVVMWTHGTEFVTKLTPEQRAQIGDQLAARITYHAQCDNYDRLGGLFFLVEPVGATPQPTDPRVELVRFITPFSDYRRGPLATLTYPDADISAYAHTLADPAHDVWIGIAGGSNPYDGDPCHATGQPADFSAIGFKYSVDLVSKGELGAGASLTLGAIGGVAATAVPVTGTFTNPGATVSGHVTVIVSGHGSAAGGDEYQYTQDTVTVNGQEIGAFSTMIDCAPYAALSPDGNPGIFTHNTTNNPRNWCPGALVPSHTFAATLPAGASTVSLGITPSAVPEGSYYSTSITFGAP
ncbi:MAG: hypothetical protein K8W52_25620 [Deltaproteobacteria bacterium]|nr:hypothetical protein [Deltaproteobacteria bacterium]